MDDATGYKGGRWNTDKGQVLDNDGRVEEKVGDEENSDAGRVEG